MSKMSRFNSSATGMTQDSKVTPEMSELLRTRNEWRSIVTLPSESESAIKVIRAYLRCGPDQNKWQEVPGGRSGGYGGHRHASSNYGGGSGSRPGYSSSGGGGGSTPKSGGGRSTSNNYSGSNFGRPAMTGGGGAGSDTASTAPAPVYVSRFSKPGTVSEPVKVAAPAPSTTTTQYKKKFSVGDSDAETIMKGQINKLFNQITEDNFKNILPLITCLLDCGKEVDSEQFLHSFMKLYIDTVVRNQKLHILYVRLINELRVTFPYLNVELEMLYDNFTSIFNNIDETKIDDDDPDKLDARTRAREFRIGYSQFIAELMRSDIIKEDRFLSILETIVSNIEHLARTPDSHTKLGECVNCLTQIISIVAKAPASPIMGTIKSAYKSRLEALTVRNPELISLKSMTKLSIQKCIEESL